MEELYLKGPRALEMREAKPLPILKENEVKIRLIYGGICGSDLSVYKGKLQYASYPLRPGHEIVGEVIESTDNGFSPGMRVVITPNTFCGECIYCKEGKPNICEFKRSIGVNCDGGFAEEIIVNSRYVLHVPDEISEEAAVLIEPLSVVVHGMKKVAVSSGKKVLVVGCGTEGLLATALADFFGGEVTAVDINVKKLELLKGFKNTNVCHPSELVHASFDVVIEAAGTKKSVESCFTYLKPGGQLLLIGITPEATIPVAQVVRNEQQVIGSIIYEFPVDFQASIDYLADVRFDPTVFISAIMPFQRYEEAYEMALSGDYAKIVLQFKGDAVS